MTRIFRLVAASTAILGCVGVWAQDSRPIRVGFVCPFTGPSADSGNSARLGAELAVSEINRVGGYLGRKIELIARDDEGKPDVGRAIAEEFVLKEKVDFTIGFCNTGVAMKSLEVFQSNQHLLMVPVSTGSAITEAYPAASSFVFRMAPSDSLQAAFIVQEVVDKRKLHKVAVLADNTAYGKGGMRDVEKLLAERNLKPVYVGTFDLGGKSLLEEVRAVKASGADALISYTVLPEQSYIAKARNEVRFTGPMFAPWPLSFRGVWEQIGADAEGTMTVQSFIPDRSNVRSNAFIARLRGMAGDRRIGSLMAAAQSYDSVYLMLSAVFHARGDTSGGALKQALENFEQSYAGVVSTYNRPFSSSDHEAFTLNMVWLGTWHNGEVAFYYPEDAKCASVVRRKTQRAKIQAAKTSLAPPLAPPLAPKS